MHAERQSNPLRVLLISYLPGIDPVCGDVTYTQTLLARPPHGVEYETYDTAVARGALREHGTRRTATQEPLLALGNKALNLLRARGVLFWEPFRFFSVRPGEYDLVHMHVFNARFVGMDCPLVVSSGAPQPDLYADRRGYSRGRVAALSRAERTLSRLLGVNTNSFHLPQADRVMVYTQHFRDYLIRNDCVAADRVDVVPIHVLAEPRPVEPRRPRRIGFVARDFDMKGGGVLLDAYRRVRRQRPDVELWIVGSSPQIDAEEAASLGIIWKSAIPRDELLQDVMPTFDVFAYPTPHDCFSYVMLEAMASGCAIATSDYVSMPEAVDHGRAGLTSPVGDADALARNILALLDAERNLRYRRAARKRFEEYFSWEAVGPRIRAAYDAAVAEHSPACNRGERACVSPS